MEWDMIREELKVREKLVGGYWEAIPKDAIGCQVSETDSDTVDTI